MREVKWAGTGQTRGIHTACTGLMIALLCGLFVPGSYAQSLEMFEDRVTEFTLENGLHFIIIERDVAPVASFVTFADVGSVNEPAGRTGVAHLFEHMVFKGSREIGTTNWEREQIWIRKMDTAYRSWLLEKNRPVPDSTKLNQYRTRFEAYQDSASAYVVNNEFSMIIEREGGTGLNAFTSADATGYFYSLPENRAELWFLLEAERFRDPVFREFYSEKQVIQEERRMRTDSSPIGRLVEEFLSVAYSAHPYRNPVIGWPSDIESTTIRDTREFYEKYYTPDRLTVAIAGDVDPVRMREFAEQYFGDLPARPSEPEIVTEEPRQRGERRLVIEEKSQPILLAGYHTVDQMHEDWPALQMLGAVISEGRTSRLYRRLVEQERVALDVSAFNGFPGTKYPSMFLTLAVPNRGVELQTLEQMIDEEIDKVKRGEVTESELERAVTNALAGLIRGLNSNRGLALQFAETHAQQGDWRRVFTYLEELESVRLEDLQRVARQYLVKENRTVGSIVNRDSTGNE